MKNNEERRKINKEFNLREALAREDVVEYFKYKSKEEIEELLGLEIAKMIGFEQKNVHHCYDLWEHTLRTVEAINKDKMISEEDCNKDVLRLSAFLHDIGKPDTSGFNLKTGQQTFYGHAKRSAEIAEKVLPELMESNGYDEWDEEMVIFLIKNHDDFINYKTKVPDNMKHHEFIREITPESVAEVPIMNEIQESLENEGCNIHEIKYIASFIASGKKPDFINEDGEPLSMDLDYYDLIEKMPSQTWFDYKPLLALCRADVSAQSDIVVLNGKQIDSKEEKLDRLSKIEDIMEESISIADNRIGESGDVFKSMLKEEFRNETDNQGLLNFIERYGIDDTYDYEKGSEYATTSSMADLIAEHANDKEFILKAIASENRWIDNQGREELENRAEQAATYADMYMYDDEYDEPYYLYRQAKGHILDFASEELQSDLDILKAKESPELIPEILEKLRNEREKHTPEEIAEGISPREGEIEEVLDETIVEQNRVNNQDKEKEGEAIGAN